MAPTASESPARDGCVLVARGIGPPYGHAVPSAHCQPAQADPAIPSMVTTRMAETHLFSSNAVVLTIGARFRFGLPSYYKLILSLLSR